MIKFKKITHDPVQYFDKLGSCLAQNQEILLVYLFGSYATGKVGPLSDIDIAILLDNPIWEKQKLKKKLQLISDISDILKTDEVDLVILNEAPNLLAYQVVSDGKLLYESDTALRVEFETRTISTYLDFKPFLEVQWQNAKRKILEGTFFD